MIARTSRIAVVLTVAAIGLVVAITAVRVARDDSRRNYLTTDGWPAQGQASFAVDADAAQSSPGQEPVPIASVAKVMTAYLVLQAAPLRPGEPGFVITVTPSDVADWRRRAARDESVVPVRAGERLTERQALAALLLPSANNVAIVLARQVGGRVGRFVAAMNRTALRLGMRHTRYTDPSGFDSATRSTAADQLRLAQVVMRNRAFAALVARPQYRLPVAGVVHNTDRLLGADGFVGIKTGSDDAAGGCFMFRARRLVDGHRVTVTGVVLGQHGHNLISAGLYAARQIVDQVSPAG
jgi:D-alanyl-D-alanine carboxypeptidase (penicillin-binding protein 5/6)